MHLHDFQTTIHSCFLDDGDRWQFLRTSKAICWSEFELHTEALATAASAAAASCWHMAQCWSCDLLGIGHFYSPASVTCGSTSPVTCSCDSSSISPLNDDTDFLLRSGRAGHSAIRWSWDLQWWHRFGCGPIVHFAAMWFANSPQL